MKKILTIRTNFEEQDLISDLYKKWPEEVSCYSSIEESGAVETIKSHGIELVVMDLSSGYGPQLHTLKNLAYRFPYLPFLVIVRVEQDLTEQALKNGASLCLLKPFDPEDFRKKALYLIDSADKGRLKGVAVHNLLQIFEAEKKTCSLRVTNCGQVGLIYLKEGLLIGAEYGDQLNEKALYSIVTLEDASIEILHFNGQRPAEIELPLISIVMEAFRLKDEKDHFEEKQQVQDLQELELEHFSQKESKISIEIGAKIHMEIDEMDFEGTGTLVGMIPDKYLLVTAPEDFELIQEILKSRTQISVKYIHMGRLCVFKTKLIDSINTPNHLLFLVYPLFINYHELRRARRTSIYVPCTLQFNSQAPNSGILIDLSSVGGLFMAKTKNFASSREIDLNTEVILNCYLPGVKGSKNLKGHVKNISKTTVEIKIGVEFIDVDEKLKDAINNYVENN